MSVDLPQLVMPLTNMQKEPPILIRMWLCFSAPKRWMKRRKIDKAGVMLTNNPANAEEEELGYRLRVLSDKLWDEEFSRHNELAHARAQLKRP